MFSRTPELYDRVYGSWKDYAAEAALIADTLRAHAPAARRLLDVACGTGEHARHLRASHGYDVDGIDLEPGFVSLARAKLPGADIRQADMVDFDMGTEYDAVLCLFSSIGYVKTPGRLAAALRRFRAHLAPGGLAVVEPFFTPGAWTPGRVFVHSSDGDGLHVVRMSHSGLSGRVATLEFRYLIGTAEGIRSEVEHHELGLFTRAETEEALESAGFGDVEYDDLGPTGRGLYLARARATVPGGDLP